MDVGKSFTFLFEDKKWVEKLLIGGLILLIPIVGSLLLMGYMVVLIRNVRQGEEYPLPEWHEFGEMIVDGLKLLLAYIVWALPIIVLWVPFVVLAIPLGVFASEDVAGGILGTLALCFTCFTVLYAILLLFLVPAVTIRYAEAGELSAALAVSDVFQFTRANLGNVVLVVVVVLLAQIAAGIVGGILCGIGALFTAFWALTVQGYLYGQLLPEESSKTLEPQALLEADDEPALVPEGDITIDE